MARHNFLSNGWQILECCHTGENKLDRSCLLRKIDLLLILGAQSKRKSLQTPSVVTREKQNSPEAINPIIIKKSKIIYLL